MQIQIKRIYEAPSASDGTRVLVDRLWPRGVKMDPARLDAWLKEIAPSDELRHEFHHDPERWTEFRARYWRELDEKRDLVQSLLEQAGNGTLTLVYAARDTIHNNAAALKAYLEKEGRQA